MSVEYVRVPSYDKDGCPITNSNTVFAGGGLDRFNLVVELSIINKGLENFQPPDSFVGTSDCKKAAIYNFYQLLLPGDASTIFRHASCLTDDSYYTAAQQSASSTCTEALTKAGITVGGGFGVHRRVKVKFPMSLKHLTALNSSSPDGTVTIHLSTNPYISEGSPTILTNIEVDKLSSIIWKQNGIYHQAVSIYTASPPTLFPTQPSSTNPSLQTSQPLSQPTSQPSEQPSSQPSEQPSLQPSEQPSSQPSQQPSEQPSSQPSKQPSKQPSSQPSEQPSSQPSKQPSEQPSSQPSEQPSSQPSEQAE